MRKRVPVVVMAIVAACVVALASPAGADSKKDKAIAKKALLRQSDLPSGWRESGKQTHEESGVRECKKIDAAVRAGNKVPHADSRKFSDSNDPNGVREVSSSVGVFPNTKAATRFFKVFIAGDVVDCLRGVGEKAVRAKAPGATVSVEEINLPNVGDERIGYTIVVTGTDGSSLNIDLVLARVGRGIAEFNAINAGGTLPEGTGLLDTVVSRLDRAL